jgi:rhodanese-related sulfurtransferase
VSWGWGKPPLPEVSVEEFLADHDPNKLVIDVREPMETMVGTIAGARCIPLGELEGSLDEVADDANVYLLCRSGSRSAYATEMLINAGKLGAKNISGGMIAWTNGGHPTAKPD